jgi:hypothetical protein
LLGGKRDIRFPTKEELSNYLLCTLFCYYRFCEKKHTDWIKEKLNIRTKRDWDFLIKTSDAWKELVEKESGVTVEWLFENGNPIKND